MNMTIKVLRSLPLALLSATLPAATVSAQTKPVTHTTRPTGAAHRASTATACIATPAISPKIPALPRTLPCAKPLYALAFVDTLVGTGAPAAPRMYYTVRYTGYLPDGSKFDSSFDHPGAEPITFPYGARQVIPGWDTGFDGMKVGGKRRLFIPYQLAYGEAGRPPVIPAKSELIFDVELVSMSDKPPAPKTPPTPPPPRPSLPTPSPPTRNPPTRSPPTPSPPT